MKSYGIVGSIDTFQLHNDSISLCSSIRYLMVTETAKLSRERKRQDSKHMADEVGEEKIFEKTAKHCEGEMRM